MPEDSRVAADQQESPVTVLGRLRHLGPGLIVTASIVGSGELIMTTKLGAEVGFALLWLVVLGCIVKVFVQVELGRYAIHSGETSLQAMNRVPGPRGVVSWVVWLWLCMYVSLFFQVSGIVGSLAQVLVQPFPDAAADSTLRSERFWLVVVTASVVLLLGWGRYRMVERISIGMVFLFTVGTLVAVVMLQWTSYAILGEDVFAGLTFRLTESDGSAIEFTTAFAAFGITGVGASELVYYPYWCLEKGYARYVGPRQDTPEWEERARGWIRVLKLDAWISLVVYTLATVAFYLLGAAVLHRQGVEVEDNQLIDTLSQMYRASFGAGGLGLFLVGAFFVLYSTFFVATASNARLFADALSIFRVVRYQDSQARSRMVRVGCVALPIIAATIYYFLGKPVSMVTVGGVAQACMLPILGATALYLRYFRCDARLAPNTIWTSFLWISFLAMATIGIYNLVQQLSKMTGES